MTLCQHCGTELDGLLYAHDCRAPKPNFEALLRELVESHGHYHSVRSFGYLTDAKALTASSARFLNAVLSARAALGKATTR
jgi:hypothetical protein